MEGKKISFGFFKTKKVDKPLVVANEEKKEYIECVEEKSIKVVGGEEVKIIEPLVIPMKPNTLITAERLKEIAEKVESALEEPEIKQESVVDTNVPDLPSGNETLDQMAVRELMQQAKNEIKTETPIMAIPAAKTAPEGQKESTLDDYEAVPIQEFGVAMLRGMGWTPSKDGTKYKQPELRPKGLGLGADKVIKENKNKQVAKDSKGEELVIVKNSFVKITTGKYSGFYGKVISLDEDNGRVMVDIAVKKETVNLSEFMMQPVTKAEYDKESKVINADSYDEYKKKEVSQKSARQEEKSSSSQRVDEKDKERRDRHRETDRKQRDHDSANGKSKDKQKRDSSSSEERTTKKKKKDRKRHSSSDSLSELSEDERRHKHSKHKSRKQKKRSRSSSRKRSPSPEGKRDIDKKRKGKKKKRDRDRSPNYKKHRK